MEKVINGEFLIRQFQETDLPAFKELLRTTWNENHIFLKSEELMCWQYQGFGKYAGMHFPTMFDSKGRMIGFRGVFSAEINIPTEKGIKTDSLAVGSLYLVIPEYRGKKLGLALQQFTQECYGNYLAIGSNLGTSAPIYRKSNYLMMERMHRYLAPLNRQISALLLDDMQIESYWLNSGQIPQVEDVTLPSKELAELWGESPCSKMLSINKSEDFWNWRYKSHPIYKYYFFGGKRKGGLIVGRICNLYDDSLKKKEMTLFRILEIIPEGDGFYSEKLSKLLAGVVQWASNHGCCMVETYLTTEKYTKLLLKNGFLQLTQANYSQIVSNYEPMAKSPKLTNVSMYLGGNDYADFESIYLSLADSDQDRPNLVEKDR